MDPKRKAGKALMQQLELFPFTERQQRNIEEANRRRGLELEPVINRIQTEVVDEGAPIFLTESQYKSMLDEDAIPEGYAVKPITIEIAGQLIDDKLAQIDLSMQQLQGMDVARDYLGRSMSFEPGDALGTIRMKPLLPLSNLNNNPYNQFHPDLMMDQYLRRIVARDGLNVELPERRITPEQAVALKSLDPTDSNDPLHIDLKPLRRAGLRPSKVAKAQGMPIATPEDKDAIQLAMVFDSGTDRDQMSGIALPTPSLVKLNDGSVVEVNHRRAGGHDIAFSVVRDSPYLKNELAISPTDIRLESGPVNYMHAQDDKARAKQMRIEPETPVRPSYQDEDALYATLLDKLVTGTDEQGDRWISDKYPVIRDWFKTHVNEVFNYPRK